MTPYAKLTADGRLAAIYQNPSPEDIASMGLVAFPAWAGAWPDQRTLGEVRADKVAELKRTRDEKIAAPKVTSFGVFDADERSQNNLNKVVSLQAAAATLGLPSATNYTLADNTRTSFTRAQLQQASLEIGGQVQALYDVYDALRAQVAAAQSIEEVTAVVWPDAPPP